MEELLSLDDFHEDSVIEGPGGPYVQWEQVRRILAEKLEKADMVWGYLDRDFGVMCYFDDEETPDHKSHTARLVCIEEVGK